MERYKECKKYIKEQIRITFVDGELWEDDFKTLLTETRRQLINVNGTRPDETYDETCNYNIRLSHKQRQPINK